MQNQNVEDILDSDILENLKTPSYVLNYNKLLQNLEILNSVQVRSNAKILVALKGYSFWREFDYLRNILHGAACSGAYEARLAFEEISNKVESKNLLTKISHKKEICVFSPAYKKSQMIEILKYATHIIFNSFSQWHNFKELIDSKNQDLSSKNQAPIQIGLRVNPLYSEVYPPIYNPCVPKSRLGITPDEFQRGIETFSKIYGDSFFQDHFSGLHFHTHCQQDSTVLERTIPFVEKYFHEFIKQSKWINFGGGHHITRSDYNIDLLVNIIKDFKKKYNDIEVFLEPGEAVGWQVGDLFASVVDIVRNDGLIAILDVSASNHMPDCLEMPYTPECYKISLDSKSNTPRIENAQNIENTQDTVLDFTYRFGGPTCLAGDIIGDYSFKSPLNIGDMVVFRDMIHYTIVKNTTFNGIELPSLSVLKDGKFRVLKEFSYKDFKERN